MGNVPLYLAIALLAALVALVGTRVVRRIALALNLADEPNERRINTTLMPRAGGFAVALSFFIVGATITILAAPLGLTGGRYSQPLGSQRSYSAPCWPARSA